jgi:hypothetical protein
MIPRKANYSPSEQQLINLDSQTIALLAKKQVKQRSSQLHETIDVFANSVQSVRYLPPLSTYSYHNEPTSRRKCFPNNMN